MNHEFMDLILLFAVVMILMIGIVTLVVMIRLYRMHDVRNEDGEYAWMVPGKWMEFQKTIAESQERMVVTLDRSTENQLKMSRLLESLTNATLALNESVNGGSNGKKV